MRRRVDEFVSYHINGDGECNGVLLKAWADAHELGAEDRFDLAFFYSAVYNIPSAVFMLFERDAIIEDPNAWCEANSGSVIYQSDRRYMRRNGALASTLRYFSRSLAGGNAYTAKTVHDGKIRTAKAVEECLRWPNFGRFGAYLFVETLTHLLGVRSENAPRFDFANGATATSGLMNVYGLDAEAVEFDRTRKLPSTASAQMLDALLCDLTDEIEGAGGNPDLSQVETSLCAYRKFFKGSRYNGYYLDRQLEELVTFPTINPRGAEIAEELYDLRARLFQPKYLGEAGGWLGIRRECKKLYRDHGVMM